MKSYKKGTTRALGILKKKSYTWILTWNCQKPPIIRKCVLQTTQKNKIARSPNSIQLLGKNLMPLLPTTEQTSPPREAPMLSEKEPCHSKKPTIPKAMGRQTAEISKPPYLEVRQAPQSNKPHEAPLKRTLVGQPAHIASKINHSSFYVYWSILSDSFLLQFYGRAGFMWLSTMFFFLVSRGASKLLHVTHRWNKEQTLCQLNSPPSEPSRCPSRLRRHAAVLHGRLLLGDLLLRAAAADPIGLNESHETYDPTKEASCCGQIDHENVLFLLATTLLQHPWNHSNAFKVHLWSSKSVDDSKRLLLVYQQLPMISKTKRRIPRLLPERPPEFQKRSCWAAELPVVTESSAAATKQNGHAGGVFFFLSLEEFVDL